MSGYAKWRREIDRGEWKPRFAFLTEREKARLTQEEQERFRWLSRKRTMEPGSLSADEEREAQMLWRKAVRT